MKNKIVFACFAFLFATCAPSAGPSGKQADRQFYMPQPSYLYFKNLRSTKYRETETSLVTEPVYEYRSWTLSPEQPQLIPQIVCRLLTDEAFIQLQPNPLFERFSKPPQVRKSRGADSEIRTLSITTLEDQTGTARLLAGYLKGNEALELQDAQGNWVPFLQSEKDRQYFLVTLQDYENLLK